MTRPPRFPTAFAALLLAGFAGAAESLSFRSWTSRAQRQEREKDLSAAKSSWSNALSVWREADGKAARAKAHCARAALREKDADDAGALADYADCLADDKKNARAFHRRGALHLKAGRRREAIDDLYKAVALDIRFGAAYLDRARAYEATGELLFAKEDYKRACELGVKEACAKASGVKAGRTPPKPVSAPGPTLEPVPPAADAPPPETAPAPRKPAGPAPYQPRFADCRAALEACLEEGGAFGACVIERPRCEDKAVKGCCPGPCLKAFSKAAASRSEAAAYRLHFAAGAACAVASRSDEDE